MRLQHSLACQLCSECGVSTGLFAATLVDIIRPVPDTKCPRCNRIGLVRHETVIIKGRAFKHHYCGGCDHTWSTGADNSRTEVSTADDKPERSRAR